MRWGVYAVLEAPNDYAASCFKQYGMNTDDTGQFSAMYKPFHLIGMELNIRTLTLNNHSMAMLKSVGLSIDAADVNKIEVLDGEGTGNIQFSSEDISEESLSHVVLFNDLRNELLRMCRDETIFSNEIQSIQNLNKESDPEVILKDGTSIKTKKILQQRIMTRNN